MPYTMRKCSDSRAIYSRRCEGKGRQDVRGSPVDQAGVPGRHRLGPHSAAQNPRCGRALPRGLCTESTVEAVAVRDATARLPVNPCISYMLHGCLQSPIPCTRASTRPSRGTFNRYRLSPAHVASVRTSIVCVRVCPGDCPWRC